MHVCADGPTGSVVSKSIVTEQGSAFLPGQGAERGGGSVFHRCAVSRLDRYRLKVIGHDGDVLVMSRL